MKTRLILLALLLVFSSPRATCFASDESNCLLEGLNDFIEFVKGPAHTPPQSADVKLRMPNSYFQTISDLIHEGKPLTPALLKRFSIPAEAIRFYDPETGKFNYNPDHPLQLAKENGDAKLQAIRIHIANIGSNVAKVNDLLLKDYQNVLEQLPGVELWISTPITLTERVKLSVSRLPKQLRSRIKVYDTGLMTVWSWAQDGSKPVTAKHPEVMIPRDLPRPVYLEPLFDLQNKSQINIRRSLFSFEGGNIIVGDRNIFTGPNTIDSLMWDFHISKQEAVSALEAEFGKPIIEIGSRSPSNHIEKIDFHIDLAMAIARNRNNGQETILLESPKRAIEVLLGDRKVSDLRAKYPEPNEFFKNLILEAQHPNRKLTPQEKDLLKFFVESKDASQLKLREDQAQELAAKLKSKGYDVILIPGIGKLNGSRKGGEELQIFNWTNSIFSGEHAIIPDLGITSLDHEVHQQVAGLGYKIIPVKTPRYSLCLHGGIRCLSETIRRPEH